MKIFRILVIFGFWFSLVLISIFIELDNLFFTILFFIIFAFCGYLINKMNFKNLIQ